MMPHGLNTISKLTCIDSKDVFVCVGLNVEKQLTRLAKVKCLQTCVYEA